MAEVGTCCVSDCDGVLRSAAYCAKHWARLKRHGDVHTVKPVPSLKDDKSPHWLGEEITYVAAHFRVRRLWGSASQYLCVNCGGTAHDWAYDGTDLTDKYGPTRTGRAWSYYSVYPEFYMPMCSKCHNRRDKPAAQAELHEYRQWKHRTGLTVWDLKCECATSATCPSCAENRV